MTPLAVRKAIPHGRQRVGQELARGAPPAQPLRGQPGRRKGRMEKRQPRLRIHSEERVEHRPPDQVAGQAIPGQAGEHLQRPERRPRPYHNLPKSVGRVGRTPCPHQGSGRPDPGCQWMEKCPKTWYPRTGPAQGPPLPMREKQGDAGKRVRAESREDSELPPAPGIPRGCGADRTTGDHTNGTLGCCHSLPCSDPLASRPNR